LLANFDSKIARRGRPAGKAQICQPKGLCLHDLAFLRSLVQGVDLESAGKRYLPELHADSRVLRSTLKVLVSQAQSILRSLGRAELAVCLDVCLPGSLQSGRSTHQILPTLSEFAEELDDPGAWSESELQEMYQDRFASALAIPSPKNIAQTDQSKALDGLGLIQTSGVKIPHETDELHLWLSKALAQRLQHAGMLNLDDLIAFVNLHGRGWYRRVPGVGKDRAVRLVQWLQDHVNFLKPILMSGVALPATVPSCDLQASTDGAILRALGTNAIGAHTDRQAMAAWLATLDFLSPHTRKAYSRDVARLLLWAQTELGKGMADLTVVDAAAHAKFLQNPPPHWRARVANANRHQIGMRGALSPSSTSRALAAIGHFYGFLIETQYLKANPFSRIRTPHDRGVQMDVQRCFSNAHLHAMQQALQILPSGPRKRRLVALLALLESTGLRIGEIPSGWDAVVVQNDSQAGPIKCLRVVGKGGRERLLPLRDDVLQALSAHANDLATLELVESPNRPLIGLIDDSINGDGQVDHSALSTARVRAVLKGFFQDVARACPNAEMAADFRRASPHFMRHTFAHRVLQATQGDLTVTQHLLGHKSISTTGIYVKAGLSQRFDAISAMSILTTEVTNE